MKLHFNININDLVYLWSSLYGFKYYLENAKVKTEHGEGIYYCLSSITTAPPCGWCLKLKQLHNKI